MLKRAHSVLTIKASGDSGKKRTFTGIATTPSTDRMGDIVEPKGMEFKLPLPLLWQHDSRDPIGWVTSAKVTSEGIVIEGEVASLPPEQADSELGKRLLKAWQMLEAKLVKGLSIGFNVLESARIEGTWGYRISKSEWLELSAVTIPANQDCSITTIKAADATYLRAASGQSQAGGGLPNRPGVSGVTTKAASRGNTTKGNTMKTLAELIARKETLVARQTELMTEIKGGAAAVDVTNEFDENEDELSKLDTDIRIARFDERQAGGNAREVRGTSSYQGSDSRSRGGPAIIKAREKDEAFKGQNFVRGVIAKAMAKLSDVSAVAVAEQRWGKSNPLLVSVIKAAVQGGSTDTWGQELAEADSRYNGDFIEFLYGATVFDKLGLRVIPENVVVKGQDGAGTGYWVGESKAIPATALDFFDVTLTGLKAAALAVISNDLIRLASPDAEMLVRDALVQASAQRVDTTFISDVAAAAGVSPAGILNGVAPISTTANTADGVRALVRALYSGFITNKNATGLTFVMHPATAKAIGMLMNALGQPEFPGLGANGGTLLGDTVVTGDNVDPSNIILLKPSDIYRIGNGGVEVSMSKEAMIEQDTTPNGASDTPAASSTNAVSMFQTDSTAVKVIRRINFAKRRASAVAWTNNADFDGTVS